MTPKPKQMMNINVKVNVKVTNGTFSKRRKNSILVIFWKRNFVMFPEYIYKSVNIFTKMIIVTIGNYINRLEKMMYEGQGHKISTFKMKKQQIFH